MNIFAIVVVGVVSFKVGTGMGTGMGITAALDETVTISYTRIK